MSDGSFNYELGDLGVVLGEECKGEEPYSLWNTFGLFDNRNNLSNVPETIKLKLFLKPSPDFDSETLDSTTIVLKRR